MLNNNNILNTNNQVQHHLKHRKLCEFVIEKNTNNQAVDNEEDVENVNFSPNLKLSKTIIFALFVRFLFEFM